MLMATDVAESLVGFVLLCPQVHCQCSRRHHELQLRCPTVKSSEVYSYIGVYIGIMEKRMETTVIYWGYIGIMEKKMETTIIYWGLYRDN